MKSHLIYPARLKVFGDGGSQVYESAREAIAALQAQGTINARQDDTLSSNQAGAVLMVFGGPVSSVHQIVHQLGLRGRLHRRLPYH